MQLNNEAYEMKKDNLVYDLSHQRDARNISIAVTEGENGIIKRGQVIDYSETEGKYTLHTSEGMAAAITASDTFYTESDTEITVPVYISGTFRTQACITDTELTTKDIENLRSKGIYLK